MSLTITWDGNTTGLDSIDTNTWVSGMVDFYKVSDRVLTETDVVGASIIYSNGTENTVDINKDYGDGVVICGSRIIIGKVGTYYSVDNDHFYITLPTDGTYFAVINQYDDDSRYVMSATFPNVEDAPTHTARDLYRKINGKPTKLTLYKKLGGKLIPLDEHTKEVKT